jgi:4-hydroxy-L-threonine phosphate dehydrogenase PdxA
LESRATLKRIGITLGDCAGIGPEIVEAALESEHLPKSAKYKVIGKYPECSLGKPTLETARAAAAALEEAVTLARRGTLAAVVTGPVHKARMSEAGFKFPGQTEFFAVTAHLPLREVPSALKQSEIVRVGLLLVDFLHRRSKKTPRIAVAGLNPHAGESGKLGREEIEIIAPAVAHLNQLPITSHKSPALFAGPVSPDTLFHRLAEGEWDAALCMYHDQGLIPLKLHAFHTGVNVTLGLPFPRTSPDHGTAFDIAGKGIAQPNSMIAAITVAVELAQDK